MPDFEVQRTTGRCIVSGRDLAEGEEFYAVLFDRGDAFERVDYSLPCWSGPPEETYCFWKARIPQRQKKPRLFVDDEVLLNFFQRLGDESEPVKVQFRFLLALILMRKRLLKYQQTVHEGDTEVWLMRLRGEERQHKVVNPQLADDQLEAVGQQLGAILHEDVSAFAELDEKPE